MTAQKRSENIQNVPISISAMSAETLSKMGIERTDDLGVAVPGLQFDRRSSEALIRIRGIGTASTNVGDEPSVAVYVDNVYEPSPDAVILNLNNVERIEVLKGPQGTLFGRNATGGVINIVTRTPSMQPSLEMEAGYGNFDTVEAKMYGTTGIGESIAADLAVAYDDQSEGYITNRTLGKRTGTERDIALRSKWLFNLGDNTHLTFTGSYTDRDDSIGMPSQPRPGTLGFGGTPYSGNFYTVTENLDEAAKHTMASASIRLDQSFSNFDFVSISAYQHETHKSTVDQDGTPLPVINGHVVNDVATVTQEFQLLSNGGGPFKWILGAFFFNSTPRYNPLTIDGLGVAPLGTVRSFVEAESTSYALFADTHYNLTDSTGITLGVRGTRDNLKLTGDTGFSAIPAALEPAPFERSTDSKEPTWRVGLDHHLASHLMVFGMYSRGYKSGVYNSVVTSGVPSAPVKPEIVDAYELGFKSDAADGLWQLNGSLFRNVAKDLQVYSNIPGGVMLSNAAKSTIQGLELNTLLAPTDHLELSLGVSWMHSKYDRFPNTQLFPPSPTGGNLDTVYGDVSGNQVPQTPDFTSSATIAYRLPVSFGEFRTSLSYLYNSGFFWEPNNRIKEPPLNMVNGEIGWRSRSQRYGVKVWGRNLLNKEYSINSSSSVFGDLYSPAPPRQYGVVFQTWL